MDTSTSPHDLDPRDLAHLCDQRAHELQARAWRSEAERDALREATADLLGVVARQLDAGALPAPVPSAERSLSEEELRALIATRVVHQSLHPTSPDDERRKGP
jgi:hypothetical protein